MVVLHAGFRSLLLSTLYIFVVQHVLASHLAPERSVHKLQGRVEALRLFAAHLDTTSLKETQGNYREDVEAKDFFCEGDRTEGNNECSCWISCTSEGNCTNLETLCATTYASRCRGVYFEPGLAPERRVEGKLMTTGGVKGLYPSAHDMVKYSRESPLRGGQHLLILIGEQKAGTTSFFGSITQHPKLLVPSKSDDPLVRLAGAFGEAEEEMHFFDSNHQIDSCNFDEYLQRMPAEFGTGERVIDATPDMLCDPTAARYVGTLFPDNLKLIALVRDPIHRAHAAWDQNRRLGMEPRSFKEAVIAEWPVAVQCSDLVQKYSTLDNKHENTAILDRLEFKYGEKCVDRKCWANDHSFGADSKGPACKRYLMKGFADMHVKFWWRHAGQNSLHITHSEEYFDSMSPSTEGDRKSATLTAFLAPVFDFIGVERTEVQALHDSAADCSHQCDIEKTQLEESMDEELWHMLRSLYAGSMSRLEKMTGLTWEGWL